MIVYNKYKVLNAFFVLMNVMFCLSSMVDGPKPMIEGTYMIAELALLWTMDH